MKRRGRSAVFSTATPATPRRSTISGSLLYKLGRFDESAAAYRRSLDLRAESASTYLHLGFALRESGKGDAALAAFHEAVRLAPNDATIMDALRETEPKSN